MAVSVTLNTLEGRAEKNPVGGVRVRVYSADGLTFITEGDTEEDGTVVLLLDDVTSYWVRFFLPGWKFPTKALVFVDAANGGDSFDAFGIDLIASPTSTDPHLCRATGAFSDPAGVAVTGARIQFLPTAAPRVLGGRLVLQSQVTAQSTTHGRIEVDLIRTAVYEVAVEAMGGLGVGDFAFEVLVPDADAVDVSDLLWPYVAAVEATVPSSLAVGETAEAPVTVVLSSSQETPFDVGVVHKNAGTFVRVLVSDQAVLSCDFQELDGVETLQLAGLAAGTATISFEVVEESEEPRFPEPTRTLPEFTVTVS